MTEPTLQERLRGAALYASEPHDGRLDALCDEGARRIDSLEAERDALREALEFYARPEHWMGITEDTPFATLLIAMKANCGSNGYSVARAALAQFDGGESE